MPLQDYEWTEKARKDLTLPGKEHIYREPYDTAYKSAEEQAASQLNYDKLTNFERGFGEFMGGLDPNAWYMKVGEWMTQAPVLGPLLNAFDVGAEGLERLAGFTAQAIATLGDAEHAAEFRKNLGAAWYAGSLAADMANTTPAIGDDGHLYVPQDLPGLPALVAARQEIASLMETGVDPKDALKQVRESYYDSLGALQLRAMMQDTFVHITADPINVVAAWVKPVERVKMLSIAARTEKILPEELTKFKQTLSLAEQSLETMSDLDKANYEKVARMVADAEDNLIRPVDRLAIFLTGGDEYVETKDLTTLGKLARRFNPFSLTAEARAQGYQNMISNHIGSFVLRNYDNPDDIMRIVSRAADGGLSPEFGHSFLTMEGRATQGALKGIQLELNKHYEAYKAVQDVAEAIKKAAPHLDLDPYELVAMFSEDTIEQLPGLLRKVLEGADEGSERFMEVARFAGLLDDETFIASVVDMKNRAWTPELFKYYAGIAVQDVVSRQGIAMFGVEAQGWLRKATDIVKAGETMAFLRLNPAFAIRNKLNNDFTMLARGIYPSFWKDADGALRFGTQDNFIKFWRETVGWEPERLTESFVGMQESILGQAVQGADPLLIAKGLPEDIERVNIGVSNIREVLDGKYKSLAKTRDFINNIKLPKKLDFGFISSKIEQRASIKAFTFGYQRAWKQLWKEGVGFDSVGRVFDDVTRQALRAEGISDGFVDDIIRAIDSRVSSSWKAQDLEGIAHDPNLNLNIDNIIQKASTDSGMDIKAILPDEFIQDLEAGLLQAAEGGVDDVRKFADSIRGQLQLHLDEMLDNQLETLSGLVSQRVAAEGPGGLARVYNNVMDDWWGAHHVYAMEMEKLRPSAALAKETRDLFWKRTKDKSRKYWDRQWDRFDAILKGVDDGLTQGGLQIKNGSLQDEFAGLQESWKGFFEKRDKWLDDFFKKKKWSDGDWDKLQTRINQEYRKGLQNEQYFQKNIDELLASAMTTDPNVQEAFLTIRAHVRQLREQKSLRVLNFRNEIKGLNVTDREAAYKIFWQEQQEAIKEIRVWETANDLALQGDRAAIEQAADLQRSLDQLYGSGNVARRIAKEFKVFTTDPTGRVPSDAHVLNIINKHRRGAYHVGSVVDEPLEMLDTEIAVFAKRLRTQPINEWPAWMREEFDEAVEYLIRRVENGMPGRAEPAMNLDEWHKLSADEKSFKQYQWMQEGFEGRGEGVPYRSIPSTHDPFWGEGGANLSSWFSKDKFIKYLDDIKAGKFARPKAPGARGRHIDNRTYQEVMGVIEDYMFHGLSANPNNAEGLVRTATLEPMSRFRLAVETGNEPMVRYYLARYMSASDNQAEVFNTLINKWAGFDPDIFTKLQSGAGKWYDEIDGAIVLREQVDMGENVLIDEDGILRFSKQVDEVPVLNYPDDVVPQKFEKEFVRRISTAAHVRSKGGLQDGWYTHDLGLHGDNARLFRYDSEMRGFEFGPDTFPDPVADDILDKLSETFASSKIDLARYDWLENTARVPTASLDQLRNQLDAHFVDVVNNIEKSTDGLTTTLLFEFPDEHIVLIDNTITTFNDVIREATDSAISRLGLDASQWDLNDATAAFVAAFDDLNVDPAELSKVFGVEYSEGMYYFMPKDMPDALYKLDIGDTEGFVSGRQHTYSDIITRYNGDNDLSDLVTMGEADPLSNFAGQRIVSTPKPPASRLEDVSPEEVMEAFIARAKNKNEPLPESVKRLELSSEKAQGFVANLDWLEPEELPYANAMDDLYYTRGFDAVEHIENALVTEVTKPGYNVDMLPKNVQSQVLQHVDMLGTKMSQTSWASVRMGEFVRDSALLNYSRRFNYNNWLGMIAPFEFWATQSMARWAIHSLDRPAMLTTYLRMRKLMDMAANPREGYPSRFRGHFKVGLPFMEPWMGKDVFFDPLKVILPFETFTRPWEDMAKDQATAEGRAVRVLEGWLGDKSVDPYEAQEALSTRSGPLWDRAVGQVYKDDESLKVDGFEFMSSIVAPHAPLVWAKELMEGTPEDIGPMMPLTRTSKGVAGMLGVDHWIFPHNIEGSVRKHFGLPAFDKWDDYRVDRMLSNMVAMNEITLEEALQAMIDRDGEVFVEAKRKADFEYGVTTTTSGLLGIPLKIYPEGEERLRQKQDAFYDAWSMYADGDHEALTRFFDENPDYEARLALWDTPEERLRKFMVDNLWDRYLGLAAIDRRTARDVLGDQFTNMFLNKQTRSVDDIAVDKLNEWLIMLGGDPPGALPSEAVPIEFAPPDVRETTELFYELRNSMFPDWYESQNEYFKLDENARRLYLEEKPGLRAYWNWRKQFFHDNPEAVSYLSDSYEFSYESVEDLRAAESSQVVSLSRSDWTNILQPHVMRLIDDYTSGDALPPGVVDYLTTLAEAYNITVDELLQTIEQAQ